MSDAERYIEELAEILDETNAFPSRNCKATGLRVLRERLLPVLEAGQALCEAAPGQDFDRLMEAWHLAIAKPRSGS
ncbi:MAG: hypothetical protein WBA09_22150 [Candidatus Acidiferrum sp.]